MWPMLEKIPGFKLEEVGKVVEVEVGVMEQIEEMEVEDEEAKGVEEVGVVEEAMAVEVKETESDGDDSDEAAEGKEGMDCAGYMAAAGMTGETAEEVMRQLGEMEATMVSNGLVVEVIGQYRAGAVRHEHPGGQVQVRLAVALMVLLVLYYRLVLLTGLK